MIVLKILTVWAVLPVGATIYFFVFWTWFDFWRTRRGLWFVLLAVCLGGVAAAAVLLRRWTFAGRIYFPVWVLVIGWIFLAVITVFATVADRQIGFRVRSFRPYFEKQGHIDLVTTGAYGVVRHPIYAAGGWFMIALFLVTGFPSILGGWVIFTLGALWFTKQEERRLAALLADPSEYDRYRARVPALFPRLVRK